MSTGDLRGNIAQLERTLKQLKYTAVVDVVGLSLGDPLAALPLLHFALLKYSRHVAAYILQKGVQLQGKTDEGFVKCAFKFLRDHLGLKLVISPGQFLEQGFAERKVLLLGAVLTAVKAIHTAAAKQERVRLHNACRQSPVKLAAAASPPRGLQVQRGSGAAAGTAGMSSRGVDVPQAVRKLPCAAATDGSQAMYETAPASPDGWTAADSVNKLLAGSSNSCSSNRPRSAAAAAKGPGRRSPLPAAAAAGAARGQQQQQQGQQHAGSPQGTAASAQWTPNPRQQQGLAAAGVLPLPYQQQQKVGLAAAGVLPLPYQQQEPAAGTRQQQQMKPQLVTCLCPQDRRRSAQQGMQGSAAAGTIPAGEEHESGADEDEPACEAAWTDEPGVEMLGARSSWQQSQQQQQQLVQQHQQQRQLLAEEEEQLQHTASLQLQQQQAAGMGLLQQQLAAAHAAMAELQQRLQNTQQQLEQQRFEEAAAARLTLLEGKVKFLENQLNSNKQQQQQGPAAAAAASRADAVLDGGGSSRRRTSAAAVAAMAMRGGVLPPQQLAARLSSSQATSPATIHTTNAPHRPSPARSWHAHSSSTAEHAAAANVEWRSAASAAAAAVVAGLSASPMASPAKWRGGYSDAAAPGDSIIWMHPQEQQQQQHQECRAAAAAAPGREGWASRARHLGLVAAEASAGDTQDAAAAAAAAGGSSSRMPALSEPDKHAAAGQAAAAAAGAALAQSFEALHREQRIDAGAAAAAAAPGVSAGGAAAAASRGSGTVSLIDKLASRALEAQQLLQAVRGSQGR